MKVFHCDGCGSLVFFENVRCLNCGHALGFLPEFGELSALVLSQNETWQALLPPANNQSYRQCRNSREYNVCNWMVPAAGPSPFCPSCALNETIPDLGVPENLERWRKLEIAKHRITYTILKLGLPLASLAAGDCPPLRFQFIADSPGVPPVKSGHLNGVITINIAEADDVERERRRVGLHEPYRTLLGHFRHEVGHYYWDRLIAGSSFLEPFRELFGNELNDYAAALSSYYQNGPPANWQSQFVSAYASAHPWEDWAETWAHYFHIIDMVETAAAFGIHLRPKHPARKTMTADPEKASGGDTNFDALLQNWFPLTYALNSLNRGMGLPDLYPFVLSAAAVEKLRFVHQVIQSSRTKAETARDIPAPFEAAALAD